MLQLLLCQKKGDINLSEELKSGFKNTINWSKYRSQMTIQPKKNNLNQLIDSSIDIEGIRTVFIVIFIL